MTSSESESSAPTLLTMPDVVMGEILGYCCYLEFQTLRKSCHRLRDTITNYKGDPKFKSIDVNIQSGPFQTNSIILTLHFRDDHPSVDLNYITDQRGCWMEKKVHSLHGKRVKFLEDQDFRDVFFRDFERFSEALKSPKTSVQRFSLSIAGPEDYGFVEKFLDSGVENLQIESLSLRIWKLPDALKFLHIFSSEHLKTLKIEGVRSETVTSELLEEMKMICLTSPNFQSCELHYAGYLHARIFGVFGSYLFGDGFYLGRHTRRYFWRTLDPRKVLLIEHGKIMLFKMIGLEEIPANAVVQG